MLKSMLAKVDRQAWRRFFIAITGLTLAFAAALYSTVARDAGSVVMTAILASFALLTAGFVGILTVPYLAKRVAAHRFRDRFQYEFTKEFAVYLIAVLVLSVEHQGLMGEIDEFFLLPEARSHGAGRQLLAAAETALAARGCVRLQLQLRVGNTAARAFYQHRGYTARAGYELLDKFLGATACQP